MKKCCFLEDNDQMCFIATGDASAGEWLKQKIRAHIRKNVLVQKLLNPEINPHRTLRSSFSRQQIVNY